MSYMFDQSLVKFGAVTVWLVEGPSTGYTGAAPEIERYQTIERELMRVVGSALRPCF